MYPTFQFFGRTIGMYGVCAALGLLASGFVATRLGKKRGLEFEDIILIMLVAGLGLLIGAHLLYGVTRMEQIAAIVKNWDQYGAKNALVRLATQFGGMVYYGGLIGAAIACFLYSRKAKGLETQSVMDIFAVSIPVFHVFGRIGCFLGGCCYGIESACGFVTYHNQINPSINGVVRFPVQLIEAGCNLTIFLLLLALFYKQKCAGRLFYVYITVYSVIRFVLEFFRGDEIRGFWMGLSTSQWVSIALFLLGAATLSRNFFKNRVDMHNKGE